MKTAPAAKEDQVAAKHTAANACLFVMGNQRESQRIIG
jgi:hypothetical protein